MSDGRLYVYGSCDWPGDMGYCSDHYYVFSTDDCEHWVCHGESFRSGLSENAALKAPVTLGGPDCAEKNGKFYLYYCTSGSGEGVAVSDNPYGPFVDPCAIRYADGDAIDPAAFVDDDGQAYYYWGQFILHAAKLKPNMRELDMSTYHEAVATEWEHGFHEGSSMRKRNGLYYLIYTDIRRGRATCLSYAIGRTPFGPFEPKGVIIDNIGCDPMSWNNHGSIEELNGQWYIFYHRSTMNSVSSRRMCAEPIYFNADGEIAEVEMTSQGTSKPIDAGSQIDASVACRLRRPFEPRDGASIHIRPCPGHGEILTMTRETDWAEYRYIDFGKGKNHFSVHAASPKPCKVEVLIEDSHKICTCDIENTGGWDKWQTFSARLNSTVGGIHAIWIRFIGSGGYCRLADIDWFSFDLEG